MKTWKKFLPDVVVIAVFAIISFAYFFVPITQGKILYQHDASAGVGAAQEMTEYQNRTVRLQDGPILSLEGCLLTRCHRLISLQMDCHR